MQEEKNVCLVLHDISADAFDELAALAPNMEIVQLKRGDMPDADVLRRVKVVYSHATKPFDALLALPDAEPDWIQMRSAGFDRLDIGAIKAKGMLVTNASGIHGTQMAESIFGVLLGKARGLFQAVRQQDQAIWHNRGEYTEITGKTMAVIGAGRIGRSVAALARHGFKMKVLGVSRRGLDDEAFDAVYQADRWQDAVAAADIVLNLLPLDDSTSYFFDDDAFAAMKRGVWFMNFGRGGTVDTAALLRALDAGQVAFAALDAFEKEPLTADSPLWPRQDIMLTPHTGGSSEHYEARVFAIFKENLRSYLATGTPSINLVDLA